MTDDHYLKPIWRVLIAVVATFIILFLGQPLHFKTAFSSPFFYLAFTVSFLVTMLLMYIVHSVTLWLDRRTPWRKAPVRRTTLQLLLGVLLPTAADIVLMTIYYTATGRDMIKRGFYLDLIFVGLFILGFNMLYFGLYAWHLLTHKEAELNTVQELLETMAESDLFAELEVKYDGGIVRLDVRDEVLYFFRENRKVMAMTVSGRSYVIQDTLSALVTSFAPVDFCQINPSVVVNLATLYGYRQGPRRETLQVVFHKDFQAAIGSERDEKYRVTKEHIDHFLYSFRMKSITAAR